jgi:hypothetical protein
MPLFGKQYRFCPNCGRKIYDGGVNTSHVLSLMCSTECRGAWQTKYAATILGVSADLEQELDEMFIGPLPRAG